MSELEFETLNLVRRGSGKISHPQLDRAVVRRGYAGGGELLRAVRALESAGLIGFSVQNAGVYVLTEQGEAYLRQAAAS